MQDYVCKFTTAIVEYLYAQQNPDSPTQYIFINKNADLSKINDTDCLVWSDAVESLKVFKIEDISPSYRLIDKDSPSYDPEKHTNINTSTNTNKYNYLEQKSIFRILNNYSINYLFLRLLEISKNINLQEKSNLNVSTLDFAQPSFALDLGSVLGLDKQNNTNSLVCLNDNSLFMNSVEQGSERENFNYVLNYGKKNLLSHLVSSNYTNKTPTDENEKERIYFLLLVLESICDLNNDFIHLGSQSEARIYQIYILKNSIYVHLNS